MSKRVIFPKFILVLAITLFLVSCSSPIIPDQAPAEWQTANPDEVGLDAQKLEQVVSLVNEGTYQNVHSILILKDGVLVFEHYFDGYSWDFYGEDFRGEFIEFGPETIHNQASVTKSFTSALVGIAIDRGVIEGVDERVFDYFPEYAHLADEAKEQITIEHLLTMTPGLEWNGLDIPINTRDPKNDVLQMFFADDPLEFILAKPMVGEPGVDWYYNGGATLLLGEILRRAAGERIDSFAEKHLFGPLGITDYEWFFIQPDLIFTAGNLKVRPRDMAKLGQMYLNEGLWQGQQIISKEWIDASVQPKSTTSWSTGYGYQWWVESFTSNAHKFESYYASGWGGQRIFVFPEQQMVVVLTGGNYNQSGPVREIIEQGILPALR